MKKAVLCVTRQAVCKANQDYGIYPINLSKVPVDEYHFINRKVVDAKDTAVGYMFPQVLPYIVVRSGNEILTYSRSKGAEDRLHGKLSLGFGGHVDIDDVYVTSEAINITSTLNGAIYRELKEELGINYKLSSLDNFKMIVDTTNDVGKVHIGLLLIIDVQKSSVKPDEEEISNPKWLTIEQIKQEYDYYENWSKLIIDIL